MPLKIIRQDITKIKCDAIVNPTNKYMIPGGGVDLAIHEAAGPELFEYCQSLGPISIGEAKITPAFGLPCKYVIHTAGPEYDDGLSGEAVLLRSCYSEAMKLAVRNKCKRVAFPLISSGTYGYPKEKVLKTAVEVIGKYLERVEMEVFILVYDKTAFAISSELYQSVESFISNFYAEASMDIFDSIREQRNYSEYEESKRCGKVFVKPSTCYPIFGNASGSLEDMLSDMECGFREALFKYIDERGLTDVEAYKRSNVSKKTFSKIKCNKDYHPAKITAVSFAVGLRLSLAETEHLLKTVGMCLSRSNKFDVIVEYFLTTGNYNNIFDVNEVLYQFDQPLLGI